VRELKAAMASLPDAISDTPEIVNVEPPGDGWARLAELQHRRGGDHQAAAGPP
jgi:glycine cleavage system H lipoate-binding protein